MFSQDMSSRNSETCLAISEKISQISNYVKRKFKKPENFSKPIKVGNRLFQAPLSTFQDLIHFHPLRD